MIITFLKFNKRIIFKLDRGQRMKTFYFKKEIKSIKNFKTSNNLQIMILIREKHLVEKFTNINGQE